MYWGVPIFERRPKTVHLQPTMDKMMLKLAAWKSSFLTLDDRLQRLKSVVHEMLIYSMTIYVWLVSLIKELDKFLRNFLWSDDLNNRKLVIMAWNTICTHIIEGGLGIRSIFKVNKA